MIQGCRQTHPQSAEDWTFGTVDWDNAPRLPPRSDHQRERPTANGYGVDGDRSQFLESRCWPLANGPCREAPSVYVERLTVRGALEKRRSTCPRVRMPGFSFERVAKSTKMRRTRRGDGQADRLRRTIFTRFLWRIAPFQRCCLLACTCIFQRSFVLT